MFVTEPAKPQPWQRSKFGLPALRERGKSTPASLQPLPLSVENKPPRHPGSWCGNLSTEARMVAGQASLIPLQHLFPFLVAWASAGCERDQASEACSLKLTAWCLWKCSTISGFHLKEVSKEWIEGSVELLIMALLPGASRLVSPNTASAALHVIHRQVMVLN